MKIFYYSPTSYISGWRVTKKAVSKWLCHGSVRILDTVSSDNNNRRKFVSRTWEEVEQLLFKDSYINEMIELSYVIIGLPCDFTDAIGF